jgi:ribosomal protein S14
MHKNILKSLLIFPFFSKNFKIYFEHLLHRYTKITSLSSYKRYCLFTYHSRIVFKQFKLSRHMVKVMASNGYLMGLRKASF